jgi:hypothetical protein
MNRQDSKRALENTLKKKGLFDYLEYLIIKEHKDKSDLVREIIYKRKKTNMAQTDTIRIRLEKHILKISKDLGIPVVRED